jgi:hypothetical protein
MQLHGIYTLANDRVYDQLVALLNSIEVNVSPDIPVCVIPFDDRLEQIKPEVEARANVSLFDNQASIHRWESFAQRAWEVHPAAQKQSANRAPWGKGHHRKFVSFDGAFEKFVFYDADSLAMKPIDDVFERLNTYDFVFNDWEHKKSDRAAALDIRQITQAGAYPMGRVRSSLHCSSFFASKRGIFSESELAALKEKLIVQGEINWVPRWWDDAFLFTYLTLRSDRPLFNFTLSEIGQERTGNCADSDPFINVNNVLYNEQGMKPIHRLHYMNYSSSDFARLAKGEDADIRYKDVFLHYRFLKEPDKKPKVLRQPDQFVKTGRWFQKVVSKLR